MVHAPASVAAGEIAVFAFSRGVSLVLCDDLRTMADTAAEISPSEATEQHRLRRQLGLRDLVLAQVLCVVGSMWVGVAAGLGRAQAVTWVAAMILFYFPMAAVVVVLNRVMPLEGGLYVWAHRAFGDLGGFLTAWNLWVYGVAVTASILYAIPTELSYLIGPAAAWLPENHAASLAIVAVIVALLTLAAVRGLELGKWIHNIGGMAMMTVFLGLILLPVWGLWQHRITRGMEFAAVMPPMNLRSMALFGQMLVGALSGLEYIAIFAGESRQPARSIARSIWIASPIICLMFILGTSSVEAFVKPGHIDFIAPIPQTLRIALGNSGVANVVAMAAILMLQLRLLGAASYLLTGVTRLPMTVGWDRLLPEWFTRLDARTRMPVNSIWCTSGLVLLLIVLGSVGVHAQEAFQVLSNASMTHYELTYMAMFAIPIVGAAALRDALPGWLKWVAGMGFCAALYAFLISAYPFVDVVNPMAYAGKILGTVLLSNLIAVGFYVARRRAG
ncbi:APC family permease [Acidicapsa acidisoli]|uniref:APC family permease n=1 Tax=Acidicapsa acidisoli TaxID=1615681 RepID=UPI0021E0CB74|nr:APC family permease [Acidicapsa acidisoli]